MKYVCPMHPEEVSNKKGRCKKCGMELIPESSLKKKSEPISSGNNEKSYRPLFIVVGLILLAAVTVSIRSIYLESFTWKNLIEYFMIGFFLVFAGFKLVDLKGFAQGYSTYDLLAKRVYSYGYVYPFIELFFALAMILAIFPTFILLLEFIIMTFSGIGVAIKLYKKEKFNCVCLGTFLKVPLTKVTLIEDFGMALLALILLIF